MTVRARNIQRSLRRPSSRGQDRRARMAALLAAVASPLGAQPKSGSASGGGDPSPPDRPPALKLDLMSIRTTVRLNRESLSTRRC